MDIINIIIATDRNFIQHAGVMLNSVFINNPTNSFNIVCIYDGKQTELKKLQKFVESKDQKFEYHYIDGEKVRDFKVSLHISSATYYRLFLPDILHHINKGIYLDCDLLVLSKIKNLWDTDLERNTIGAVFQNNQEYFNGGVLLVDFQKWRENGVTNKLVQWLNKNSNSVVFWDQDALNAVLKNHTYKLPQLWNQSELSNQKGIIHFIGAHKPWNFHCQHPNKELYFQYLSNTPWKNFKIKEKTISHYYKQLFKQLLNKTGFFEYETY